MSTVAFSLVCHCPVLQFQSPRPLPGLTKKWGKRLKMCNFSLTGTESDFELRKISEFDFLLLISLISGTEPYYQNFRLHQKC